MRDLPPFKTGFIYAKDAMIFWSALLKEVVVIDINDQPPPSTLQKYNSSGGACNIEWQHLCANEMQAEVLCLRAFWNLVYVYEIDPVTVDNALSVIIEYQKAFKDPQA